MSAKKYIRTEQDQIIIFGAALQHSDFKHFNPKSAGSIAISTDADGVTCECYGESISLGLKSDTNDSERAYNQLFNPYI